MPIVEVTENEKNVLMAWKKRSDTLILIRLKAEAVLYVSEGVAPEIVAKLVDRSVKTVQGWLRDWQETRLCSVVTGHAGNENAAKLTRTQKAEVKALLAKEPSESGIEAEFWDVPALRDVVKIYFDIEYAADSSYHLLMRLCGMSFKLPDPFDKRRDETAITARMAEVRAQVAGLLAEGYEVYTIDEVRVEHEAETRRMWLPKGQRTKLYVDRKRAACSFFGALSLTSGTMRVYPINGQQNGEQVILALERLNERPPKPGSRWCWTMPGSTTRKRSPHCTSQASCWTGSPQSTSAVRTRS
ncbi:MAG: IS630 family transposase [Tessaracoccus sp.]